MKRFVTDVNVIFSVLISGKESYLRMFTDFEMLLPDFELDLPFISKDDILVDGLRANGYTNILKLSEFFDLMEKGEV